MHNESTPLIELSCKGGGMLDKLLRPILGTFIFNCFDVPGRIIGIILYFLVCIIQFLVKDAIGAHRMAYLNTFLVVLFVMQLTFYLLITINTGVWVVMFRGNMGTVQTCLCMFSLLFLLCIHYAVGDRMNSYYGRFAQPDLHAATICYVWLATVVLGISLFLADRWIKMHVHKEYQNSCKAYLADTRVNNNITSQMLEIFEQAKKTPVKHVPKFEQQASARFWYSPMTFLGTTPAKKTEQPQQVQESSDATSKQEVAAIEDNPKYNKLASELTNVRKRKRAVVAYENAIQVTLNMHIATLRAQAFVTCDAERVLSAGAWGNYCLSVASCLETAMEVAEEGMGNVHELFYAAFSFEELLGYFFFDPQHKVKVEGWKSRRKDYNGKDDQLALFLEILEEIRVKQSIKKDEIEQMDVRLQKVRKAASFF